MTSPGTLSNLLTPALVLDRSVMQRNIDRMADNAERLDVPLRPHVKTPKCVEIAKRLTARNARGITTSTLLEAEIFLKAGIRDIFYAVPLAPAKVDRALALRAAGADLICLVDDLGSARQIAPAAAARGAVLPLIIEADVDSYRTGMRPDSDEFLELAHYIHEHNGTNLRGIMSYGGDSYNCPDRHAMVALAEMHRRALVSAAERLRAADLPCDNVSFGSTPATLYAQHMEGVTECRCGIYTFQDLLQAGIGACTIEDIALTVLATVVSHRPRENQLVIDAGGMALSKDRSTQGRPFDASYGLVCNAIDVKPIGDLQVSAVSQELGIITSPGGSRLNFETIPVGTQLRILPNHADMTAAAYDHYYVVDGSADIVEVWPRYNGW